MSLLGCNDYESDLQEGIEEMLCGSSHITPTNIHAPLVLRSYSYYPRAGSVCGVESSSAS
jgi:hypothetical protein